MRALFLAGLGFGALALGALAGSASPAEARDFPFCMKGQEYASGTGDCSYPSYAACQAAASGTYSYCARNPFYASAEYAAPQRKGRRAPIEQGY